MGVTARDVMRQAFLATTPDRSLADLVPELAADAAGAALVVDRQGRLAGIVTEADFLRRFLPAFRWGADVTLTEGALADPGAVLAESRRVPVEEAMTRHVVSVGPDASLLELVRLLAERRLKVLPVVEGGRPLGIVLRRDVLAAVIPGAGP